MEEKIYNAFDADEMKQIEDIEELRAAYKKFNEVEKAKIDAIDSIDELKKMEDDLMKAMDEHDKYIKEVEYELPESVKFEDDTFNRFRISMMIKSFLERLEVEFTYTYGLYMIAKFWATNPAKIGYGTLDSSLRLLEQLKYNGKDWKNILTINAFFQKANTLYNKDMTRTLFLAEYHNMILERMQLIDPAATGNLPETNNK